MSKKEKSFNANQIHEELKKRVYEGYTRFCFVYDYPYLKNAK